MLQFLKRKPKIEEFHVKETIAGELIEELHPGFMKGKVYTTSQIESRLAELLKSSGIDLIRNDFVLLKKKMNEKYGKFL